MDSANTNYANHPDITETQIKQRMREFKATWETGQPMDVEPQWHTPKEYIDAVVELMGAIDLDPASCERAQQRIKAKTYFTRVQNGLIQPWTGRVFLNPNYARLTEWFEKLRYEYLTGKVHEAVVLTNTMETYKNWFSVLSSVSSAICLIDGQVKWEADHLIDTIAAARLGLEFNPTYDIHGNIFFYLGHQSEKFKKIFNQFGACYDK